MIRQSHLFSTLALAAPLLLVGCGDSSPATSPATPPEPEAATAAVSSPDPGTEAARLPAPVVDPYQEDLETSMGIAHRAYRLFLEEIVSPGGLVRYDVMAHDKPLRQVGIAIKQYSFALTPEDTKERIAFYCNAYNANMAFHACMEKQKTSFTNVNDIEGFFDKRSITVAGEPMTFNILENDRLRPLGDPRIHAALVCAAMSCPPLRNEPYRGYKLDEQLDFQCKRWVNDPSRNRVENGKLLLSEIFNWYGEDFNVEPYNGVVGFLKHYAAPGGDLDRFLEATPDPEIEWMPYNWTLNAAPITPR